MGEKVKCPICGKRLFDIIECSIGSISIKCSECRQVVLVKLSESTK